MCRFFFCKQKTAYEMRISDWSSDVCSSDLFGSVPMLVAGGRDRVQSMALLEWLDEAYPQAPLLPPGIEDRYTARELAFAIATELHAPLNLQIGSASCRERVCQYV